VIILDTHTLLWMDRDDPSLGAHARQIIEQAWRSDTVAVSAISIWEATMLTQRGRISLPVDAGVWRAELLQAGVREIPVDGRIAIHAVQLQGLHPDPADRFIIATALREGAMLVTADQQILDWQADMPRQDARQ